MTAAQTARLEYLRNWVMARIDELLVGVPSLDPTGASVTAPVGYIDEELDKAARYILLTAPRHLVMEAAVGTRTMYPEGTPITALSASGVVVTAVCDSAHGLKIGDRVLIALVGPAEYRGTFTVTEIPSTTSFKYELETAGDAITDQTGTWTAVNSLVKVDYDDGYAASSFPVPDDFLRFIRMRLNSWSRSVTSWVDEHSPVYRRQQYATSRGTAERPVVALIPYYGATKIGKKMLLQCWPAANETEADELVKELIYVPETPCYDLPATFEEALVWKAAETVLTIMRQYDPAKVAQNKYVEAFMILDKGMRGSEGEFMVAAPQPPARGGK